MIVHGSSVGYDGHPWEKQFKDDYFQSIIKESEMNAYLYSQNHKYEYQRIYIPTEKMENKNIHKVFAKLYALADMIERNYDYVVILDVDVFFMQPNISLESKMKEWNPSGKAEIFMPDDTLDDNNKKLWVDGVPGVNSGFQIWKVTDKTRAIVKQWIDFDSIENKKCSKFKNSWPYEQGYFISKFFLTFICSNISLYVYFK